MYPNGTILNIAVHDAELAESLLTENEQQVSAEKRPAKKTARARSNVWAKHHALVAATEPCANCGD